MLGNVLEYWAIRSFKRELAVIAFFFWMAISIKVFWMTEVALINALASAYGTASMSVWLYVAAAFGLDYYSKIGNPQSLQGHGNPPPPPVMSPPGVLPKVPPAPGNGQLTSLAVLPRVPVRSVQ